MTRALQCLLTVALLFSSSTALADAPPVARAAPVTDTYFGEQVVAPRRLGQHVFLYFWGV